MPETELLCHVYRPTSSVRITSPGFMFTIHAASTALFSTWIFVEEVGVLFDAGDGVAASLGQKGGKVDNVFITHADRDHVCGLLQFHQLNARNGQPNIFYPSGCGSFPALKEFMEKFDPQSGPATWTALDAPATIEVGRGGYSVEVRSSDHIVSECLTKAMDFMLVRSKRVLRPEFSGLPGKEIAAAKAEHGEDAVTSLFNERMIGYSGDASGLKPDHWQGVKVLFHEATFLDPDTARRAHSNVQQVIEAAGELEGLEKLVLLHFSARYDANEIKEAIRSVAAKCGLKIPVYAVLPGEVEHDVLKGEPVWMA